MKTTRLIGIVTAIVIALLTVCSTRIVAQEIERATDDSTNTEPAALEAMTPEEPADAGAEEEGSVRRVHREAMVSVGNDIELKTNETAEAMVVIGGSAMIRGDSRETVVVGGSIDVDGTVGNAVVVGGDIIVRGTARREIVAIFGNVRVEPGSEVHDVVCIGGRVQVEEGGRVSGRIEEVPVSIAGMPSMDGLKEFIRENVLKFRPLAPGIGWTWIVWGVFLGIYLFIAAAFPKPVDACVRQLAERPATSFLVGFLFMIFLPIVFLILAMTGIGLLVVPFLVVGQLLALLAGKVAVMEFFGGRLGRMTNTTMLSNRAIAFVLGAGILTLAYMVPILGGIVLMITSIWGFGAAITAIVADSGKENRSPPSTPVRPNPVESPAYAAEHRGTAAAPPSYSASAPAEAASQRVISPPVPETEIRAGFWERMGAAFLDVVLICVLGFFVNGAPMIFFVALAYFAGMWAWKGTTVGGVVLRLKVVRADGQPLSFPVSLVRGLSAAFSAIVLFLGFFWIAWDPEKQAWHDRIAGTIVIRSPQPMSLVCL